MRYDIVVIGGGAAGCSAARVLAEAGKKVCLVTEGLTLRSLESGGKPYEMLAGVSKAGAYVMRGNAVKSAEWQDDLLLSVKTDNDVDLFADVFVLATGRFFSRGLVATMDTVYERIFDADVVYPKGRENWYDTDFLKPQPFDKISVVTVDGKVQVHGRVAANLYAAGEIICSEDPAGSGEELAALILKNHAGQQ